jgi:hypothetical protein
MARWDDILMENSRLLLHAEELELDAEHALEIDAPTHTDDEGHDTQIQLHRRWHFPRALRWWTHRSATVNLAG